MNDKPTTKGRVIAFLMGTFIFLITLGTLARLVVPIKDRYSAPDGELGYAPIAGKSGRYESNEYKNRFRLNSVGGHDREPRVKSDDLYRIVVVGDSFVQGIEVPLEKNFTNVVEEVLARESLPKKVELINLDVGGYSTCQGYLLLKRTGFPLKPDHVMLGLSDNDFYDNTRKLKRWHFI